MSFRSIFPPALVLAFALLSAVFPCNNPAHADQWLDYRTAICSEEDGYAEFRRSGFYTESRPDDYDRRVPELPLTAAWGERGVEHSWRCDLSEDRTITIRYTLFHDWMDATVWVNKARVATRRLYLKNPEHWRGTGRGDNLEYIALDGSGLRICTTGQECEETPWERMPREEDPAYRPGWRFGETPRLKATPLRIVTGENCQVCQKLFEELAVDHMSDLYYLHTFTFVPFALSLSKDSAMWGGLRRGIHDFDIDNDGVAEHVYTTNTAGDMSRNYYVVLEGKDVPEATKRFLEKPQHYLNFPGSFAGQEGMTLLYFEDFGSTVTFPIQVDGRVYLYVRAFNPRSIQLGKGKDAVTHAVYEYKPSVGLETICEFSAPYVSYDEQTQ